MSVRETGTIDAMAENEDELVLLIIDQVTWAMAQTIRRQGFFFISDTDRIQISVSGIYQGFYKQRGWRTEKEKSAHRIQCTQQGVRQ